MEIQNLLTQDEAAHRAGVNRQAINRAIKEGRLPAVRVLGKNVVTEAALSQYIAEQGQRNGANAKKSKA